MSISTASECIGDCAGEVISAARTLRTGKMFAAAAVLPAAAAGKFEFCACAECGGGVAAVPVC